MLPKSKLKLMFFLASFIFTLTSTALAHCDSMEGPVVKASQKALETGNLNYVLIWVRAEDEQEIKTMFNKVNKVGTLSPEAKELADMYFFETVVRVHRMGEGEGYTGIKPAGYKPEAGIEAADIAIEKDSLDEILKHLDEAQQSEVKHYFAEVQSKKNFDINDVSAGREYVEVYVHFIHYVEALYGGGDKNMEHLNHH